MPKRAKVNAQSARPPRFDAIYGDKNEWGMSRDALVGSLRYRMVIQEARRALRFFLPASEEDIIKMLTERVKELEREHE